jgi:hypothetical protein
LSRSRCTEFAEFLKTVVSFIPHHPNTNKPNELHEGPTSTETTN